MPNNQPTQLTNVMTQALKKAMKCVQQNQSINWKLELKEYEDLLNKITKEGLDVRLTSREF